MVLRDRNYRKWVQFSFRNLSALIQLFELFGHGQLLGQDGAAEESSFMCKDSINEQKGKPSKTRP